MGDNISIINKNLKFLRKQRGYTQQELADILEIKRSSIGAYEEGRAKPNLKVQQNLAKIFNLSLDQLLTKDLSKFVSQQLFADDKKSPQIDLEGKGLRVLSITVDKEDNENIELVPQKAAAGYLNGYADPEYISDLPRFRLPMLGAGTFRAFEISGDSMLPLQPGSIVVGEYVSDWTDVKDGHTYVILSKQEGVVYKRLFNQIEGKNSLILRSDNPSYAPYEIQTDDVMEVWKAKLFITAAAPEKDTSLDQVMNMVGQLQKEVQKLKEEQ